MRIFLLSLYIPACRKPYISPYTYSLDTTYCIRCCVLGFSNQLQIPYSRNISLQSWRYSGKGRPCCRLSQRTFRRRSSTQCWGRGNSQSCPRRTHQSSACGYPNRPPAQSSDRRVPHSRLSDRQLSGAVPHAATNRACRESACRCGIFP